MEKLGEREKEFDADPLPDELKNAVLFSEAEGASYQTALTAVPGDLSGSECETVRKLREDLDNAVREKHVKDRELLEQEIQTWAKALDVKKKPGRESLPTPAGVVKEVLDWAAANSKALDGGASPTSEDIQKELVEFRKKEGICPDSSPSNFLLFDTKEEKANQEQLTGFKTKLESIQTTEHSTETAESKSKLDALDVAITNKCPFEKQLEVIGKSVKSVLGQTKTYLESKGEAMTAEEKTETKRLRDEKLEKVMTVKMWPSQVPVADTWKTLFGVSSQTPALSLSTSVSPSSDIVLTDISFSLKPPGGWVFNSTIAGSPVLIPLHAIRAPVLKCDGSFVGPGTSLATPITGGALVYLLAAKGSRDSFLVFAHPHSGEVAGLLDANMKEDARILVDEGPDGFVSRNVMKWGKFGEFSVADLNSRCQGVWKKLWVESIRDHYDVDPLPVSPILDDGLLSDNTFIGAEWLIGVRFLDSAELLTIAAPLDPTGDPSRYELSSTFSAFRDTFIDAVVKASISGLPKYQI